MAMTKEEIIDVDIHENSLDNSADSELLSMVEEESFGRPQIVTHSILNAEEELTYSFKDLPGGVTYKLVQMTGEEPTNNMSNNSPSHVIPNSEFYVISNPGEVFSTSTTQKKAVRTQQRRQPMAKAITAKKRDDKRRATHNEVERRRRDKINNWITRLAALVPNSGLPDTASKGGILAKACDHITDLTQKQKKLEKLEVDNDKLVLEILRLNQELAELRKENASMRVQLADNCIVNTPNNRPKGQKS